MQSRTHSPVPVLAGGLGAGVKGRPRHTAGPQGVAESHLSLGTNPASPVGPQLNPHSGDMAQGGSEAGPPAPPRPRRLPFEGGGLSRAGQSRLGCRPCCGSGGIGAAVLVRVGGAPPAAEMGKPRSSRRMSRSRSVSWVRSCLLSAEPLPSVPPPTTAPAWRPG